MDIIFQTLYSELVQRCLDSSFMSDFSHRGRFVAVEVKHRKYWYFDTPKPDGGHQHRRYVGPYDDPDITRRVNAFKEIKADLKRRRSLVSTLTRQAHLPRPPTTTGRVVEGLSNAGFFRLRGVLVGTVAYQCYAAVLGKRLNAAAMQTGDADFAQSSQISVAVDDSLPPIMDVLAGIDPTFRAIPSQMDSRSSTQFMSAEGYRIEFLTPHRGSDSHSGKPVRMPSLGGASAYPLRFLDFLIHEPIRAVLLHAAGVPVLIPSPERYAVHKLIVASRRLDDRDVMAKSAKDRLQARSIFEAMIRTGQKAAIASAYMEAWNRGDAWKKAIRKSIDSYDDGFRTLLRQELARGIMEFDEQPDAYELNGTSTS